MTFLPPTPDEDGCCPTCRQPMTATAISKAVSAERAGMIEALEQAQRALAMLTEPKEIAQSSPSQAWAVCVAAEQRVRSALRSARGEK